MISITSCSNSTQPIAQTAYAQQPSIFEDYDALGAAVAKSNLQHGFTQVPNDVMTCPQISSRAKRAYEGLLFHARQKDTCYPGHARLAEVVGCSENTIRRGLADLRDYLVRVDAETGRLVVDEACPACSQVQDEEPDPRKKPFCRCHVHTCLVIWIRRGLTHTNLYVLPPRYSTLKELEAALSVQSAGEITSAQDEAFCVSSSVGGSGTTRLIEQERPDWRTNHTKSNNTQGNEGSSVSMPGGGGVTIGNTEVQLDSPVQATKSQYSSMHEMPTYDREQTNTCQASHRNRTPNPQEKGTGRENAKAVNDVNSGERLKQRHREIRAAAAAGIDPRHMDELNRQSARRDDGARTAPARQLPDWLEQAMIDFSRELNDSNRTASNITNLDRVYTYCRDYQGFTDEQFYYLIAEMKQRARRAVMMDTTPEGKPARAKYFFTCLYNEVGYRPAKR